MKLVETIGIISSILSSGNPKGWGSAPEAIIKDCTFSQEEALAAMAGADRFAAKSREVYFPLQNGAHSSKPAAKFLRLDAHNTIRNWKMMTTLSRMAAEGRS